MATWGEVQERVRATFRLDSDGPDEFALTVPRQAGSGREQRVMVRRYRAWDRELVEFRSAFGERGDFDADALLQEALQLPIGGIALHGRFWVVVHKECLDQLTVDGVLFLLTRVSLLADVLEERRGGDRF